jgi:hypothetical protein
MNTIDLTLFYENKNRYMTAKEIKKIIKEHLEKSKIFVEKISVRTGHKPICTAKLGLNEARLDVKINSSEEIKIKESLQKLTFLNY